MNDLEKAVLHDAQKAIGEAIKTNLTGYNSSFNKLVNKVVEDHEEELRAVVDESFATVIKSDDFKKAVYNAFNHTLAKLLVAKLEGGVEKTVNTLRSDPTIKARMILAIENIVKDASQKHA